MRSENSSADNAANSAGQAPTFMGDLKTLYEAAGGGAGLTYTRLVDDAKELGFEVSKTNLNAWLSKNPPTKLSHVEYVLRVLIPFLKKRAALRSPGYAQITEASWGARLAAAQKVSKSGQGGRGTRVHAASRGRLLGGPSQALRDVLPPEFVGREEELAALEAFVKAPDGAPAYLWWQAGPWAGKTALLSWFAARCLPAGVDVAHYIIAGRLGTDRRDGFVRTIKEQLDPTAGPRRRPAIDPGRPDLDPLYAAAAAECAGRDRRLVLIVDGLDEDADAGPDETGIAGLLPKDPPSGMRVIVAGRPHPRVPMKLATDHPLRDPSVVRLLSASPAAAVIRDAALTELRTLLDDPLGQRLLGLLVSARGALTGADLAELTDTTPHKVQNKLRGVVGRSLAPTRTDLLPLDARIEAEAEAGRQTFVLAHIELHTTARAELGRRFLAARTGELHDWAREYQDEDWPHDTPNYLLTGYTHLLHENRDTERLAALVLDPRRQLRLVQRAGPDVAVRQLDLVTPPQAKRTPPLGPTAAAAASREMLLAHFQPLPASVAGTVARLGDARRARALAGASGHAVDKARNLARVARVLRAMDDGQAADTAREAGQWARRALREADRLGYMADEAEAAAGQAALALLETARPPGHGDPQDAGTHGRQVTDSHPVPAPKVAALDVSRDRQGLYEDGLALLRSLHGTGTARNQTWAQAACLLEPDHPDQARELLDEMEEQAEELAAEDPAEVTAAAGAIHLWQTVADTAPDRADRLLDRILAHAEEVWSAAPTLEHISTLAAAASLAAQSRPTQAQQLINAACRHVEHVLAPDAAPLSSPDAFHIEFGFQHTVTLLSQALTDVGTSPTLATRVLKLAERALPAEPDLEEQLPGDEGEEEAFTQAAELADEAFRLAGHGANQAAEHHLERSLALLPVTGPGTGRSPAWLPDLAGALIRTDPATDTQPLLDLVQHPADRVQIHAALAMAHTDAHQPAAARRHAQEASRAAARAATPDRNWPYAAQALACASEVQAAVDLIEQHQKPDSTAKRSAWRQTDRAARIAVATELATHAPQAAGELILPLLTRLEASRHAIRSQGRLASLAELLPAAAHLPPEPQQLLKAMTEQASAQLSRNSPHLWQPEDVLVHAFLRIEAGEDPGLQLNWLTHDMTSRGPEYFPTPALALLHAALGDNHTAVQVAKQPTAPHLQAAALTTVASHLAHIPVRPHPMPDPTGTIHFTRAVQHLALNISPLPPDHEASAKALHLLLTTTGWHHAIQTLHARSPEAITAIRDITITHLHASPTPQRH
ncbi:hypothetical protein [Streptomyces yunnanensis]|uniref:Uncharacterized protein n=1 Tax=Streptomyces yunnanensis TaxID=156453 RepID=A0A9X8N5K9_9ACTN|nr:hypothetical protein [Streptomyces yunnanensis]SHN07671.1 hypothetical protein SAMN05216268_11933 [Streptomyces yunnanensis]